MTTVPLPGEIGTLGELLILHDLHIAAVRDKRDGYVIVAHITPEGTQVKSGRGYWHGSIAGLSASGVRYVGKPMTVEMFGELFHRLSAERRVLAAIGARGGSATSEAKTVAAQANGRKGGRPRHTLFHRVTRNGRESADGEPVTLLPGADLQRAIDEHNISDSTLRRWETRGWIENRGHWVLTKAGYREA